MAYTLLRLMAIWIVAYRALNSLILILSLTTMSHVPMNSGFRAQIMWSVAGLTIWLLTAAFLWFRAESLAGYCERTTSPNDEPRQIDADQLFSVGLALMGIAFLIIGLSGLAETTVRYFMMPKAGSHDYLVGLYTSGMIKPVIMSVVGVLCVSGSHLLSCLIGKAEDDNDSCPAE